MAGGMSVTISALKTCEGALSKQAGNFGDMSKNFSKSITLGMASPLGALSGIHSAAASINTAASKQVDAAEKFLNATSGAVGDARTAYVNADNNAANAAGGAGGN